MWKLIIVGAGFVGTTISLCTPTISAITSTSATLSFSYNETVLPDGIFCSLAANSTTCDDSRIFESCNSTKIYSELSPGTQYGVCLKCSADLIAFSYANVSFTTLLPSGGWCTDDSQCDDGIDCTQERCGSTRFCQLSGISDCNDNQNCTTDVCVPKFCYNSSRPSSTFCTTDKDCPGGYCTASICFGGIYDGLPCRAGTVSSRKRTTLIEWAILIGLITPKCVLGGGNCIQGGTGGCAQYPLNCSVSTPSTSLPSSFSPTPTPTPACATNADCDDSLSCTINQCVNGACTIFVPQGTCQETCEPSVDNDVCDQPCWKVPVCNQTSCDCVGSCTYNLTFWRSHNARTSCFNQSGPCQQTIPWPSFAGLSGDMESTTLCDALIATQTLNTNSCLAQVNCSAFGPCVLDLFDLVAFQPGGAFTYRLIQEWIVYHLNTANGRDPCPSCVTLELENADIIASNLITRICQPNSEIVSQYSTTVINSLISIFSAYNNGELGPGKCATDNEVYCTPQPDCGCTYTRGYWQSPRFRTYPYSSKKKSPDSVKDTCNWPSNSTDHKEDDLVNCQVSGVKITKWDVEHRTYKGKDLDTLGINKQWTNAMAQAIAFQLNLLNGACAVGCQHSEYISGQCELINQFYVADVYPFLQPNGQSCKVSASAVIGTCGTACQSLCSELATLTACNMATVLESFNNGTNGIGPGHCESTPDGNVTRRGCCENCNCYSPACDPEIVYFASESSAPQTDDGLTLDEELDIAMLVFIIIGTLTVIGIGTMMCMWMRNPQSAFTMFMSKKFDAVTPVESKRGTFRFYN